MQSFERKWGDKWYTANYYVVHYYRKGKNFTGWQEKGLLSGSFLKMLLYWAFERKNKWKIMVWWAIEIYLMDLMKLCNGDERQYNTIILKENVFWKGNVWAATCLESSVLNYIPTPKSQNCKNDIQRCVIWTMELASWPADTATPDYNTQPTHSLVHWHSSINYCTHPNWIINTPTLVLPLFPDVPSLNLCSWCSFYFLTHVHAHPSNN